MKNMMYDMQYGKSNKYTKQYDEYEDSQYMQTYIHKIRQQLQKNKRQMSKQGRRQSKSRKRSKRQKNSDDQRYPWQDRYKGKTKQKQLNQKQKQQYKNIEYQKLFNQLYYGNGSDVVTAGTIYKDILQNIVFYIMEKQLQMDVICGKTKGNNAIKLINSQSIKQNIKKQKVQNKQNLVSIVDSSLQQSIQVPIIKQINAIKGQNQQHQQSNKIEQQPKMIYQFAQDRIFQEECIKLKRASLTKGIISMIPYKSIPSLMLISLLNFIIHKTSQTIIAKYFNCDDKYSKIYKQLNSIAVSSKKYLIQQKLLKGMRYINQVQQRLNKVYTKKGSRLKINNSTSGRLQNNENIKDVRNIQYEQRKISSSKQQQTSIVQQRKQQTTISNAYYK